MISTRLSVLAGCLMLVVLAGCSDDRADGLTASSGTASVANAAPTPTATTTSSSTVVTSSSAAVVTQKPLTPEEEFDARAIREGWATSSDFKTTDGKYNGPAGYVKTICAELDSYQETPQMTRGERMDIEWSANKPIFEAGVPLFCPQHVPLLKDAQNGTVKRNYGNGSYFVPEDIKPGKFRTLEPVKDCYWERTGANGSIIANNFITVAKQVTVTVGAKDGAFTTQGCGYWQRVG